MSTKIAFTSKMRTSISGESKSGDPNSIENIIESPIRCGYFHYFSEMEHNAENINFLIAVMRFRDILLADKSAWTREWREIDSEMENCVMTIEDGEERVLSTWPSNKVHRPAAVQLMDEILGQFVLEDAPHQICLSREVTAKTLNRAKNFDIYGPEVFTEATFDPLKTMRKDILPRFLKSELAAKLSARLATCDPLPLASQLLVLPPDTSIIDDASPDDFPTERRFALLEILNCSILYDEFMMFVRRSLCSENLLCVRMIKTFEDAFDREDYDDAEEIMWNICLFFIAPGSAYEVSLRSTERRWFMLRMAKPTLHMFDDVKAVVMSSLKRNFEDFESTDEYLDLSHHCRSQFLSRQPSGRFSCFGK